LKVIRLALFRVFSLDLARIREFILNGTMAPQSRRDILLFAICLNLQLSGVRYVEADFIPLTTRLKPPDFFVTLFPRTGLSRVPLARHNTTNVHGIATLQPVGNRYALACSQPNSRPWVNQQTPPPSPYIPPTAMPNATFNTSARWINSQL
jgi:hypothetical protein